MMHLSRKDRKEIGDCIILRRHRKWQFKLCYPSKKVLMMQIIGLTYVYLRDVPDSYEILKTHLRILSKRKRGVKFSNYTIFTKAKNLVDRAIEKEF